jgi:D-amino-acid dehydrogenase
VITGVAERRAREIVLALGAWSPALGRELGIAIPVQPGKGYSITYERPAVCPRIPLTLKERSVCVTAWADGYRLGSTMEFAGYDSSLNRHRLDALVRGASEYLIEAEGPRRVEEWYGWRPMTWDDLPIIGRAPRYANLTLATGHGMLGVTLSAITGLLVSEIVCGRPPSVDPTPYLPSRFA